MSVTIPERVRRILGEAICDRDAAEAFCDNLESGSVAANGNTLFVTVPIEDLAAGDDITGRPLISADVGITLESVTLQALGAFAGIDALNTMVVTVKDGSANTIVTITYDDGTVPVDNGSNRLGALDGTHKILAANSACKITITNGATADPPAMNVLLAFHVT